MMYRNDFSVAGKVITERPFDEGHVLLTLISKNSGRVIFPIILCKKETVPEYTLHNTYLEVSGYAKGYYVDTKNGKTLVPRLTGTSVKYAETILEKEFGEKGRFYEVEPGILRISGKIDEIKDDSLYSRYVIITEEPETKERIPVRIDWRKTYKHPEFKEGDEIRAVCQISTPKKTIGTEERIYLNFNVIDMDYLTK